MDNAAFRLAFPQFADPVAYPDARLTLLSGFVGGFITPDVWGTSYDYATMLYVAHLLSIQGPSVVGGGGSSGGGSTGVVSSKTVDKVSVSFDVSAGTYEGAGFWNLSRYGVELYQLIMMVGAGPRHFLGDSVVFPTFGTDFSPGFGGVGDA